MILWRLPHFAWMWIVAASAAKAAVTEENSEGLLTTGGLQSSVALQRSIERTLSGWRSYPKLEEYRLKTKEMFYTGLYHYMDRAFPKDELMPITGTGFDTLGNFSLTLIDALDTTMVMGDVDQFLALLPLIKDINFNINVNVSVFETNIRVVGGLLSAHIMAFTHPKLAEKYDHSLLGKAEEMAKKLLQAFDTPTGLPFGTINLLTGVHEKESLDVCTACAGTFSIEFTWLSLLTDDPIYEVTARKAVRALWKYRSKLDLFGNHINVQTGKWPYQESTIAGLVDSFYEYLLKASIAFSDEIEYEHLFVAAYRAVKLYMKKGDWHYDVHMTSGVPVRPFFYSLGAFWPGLKILAGDVEEGMRELNAISEVFRVSQFLPEALHLHTPVEVVEGRGSYPLRPEFVESLWVAYRATKNPTILETAYEIVDRLNTYTRTKYGFANVKNVVTMELEDKMESFFLAETLKYLYLLFDAENEYNSGNYVFNTEAHPFPVTSYYRTIFHPYETEESLNHLFEPWTTIPDPSVLDHSYRGDEIDPVVSGFRYGVCWANDWKRGRGINIDRWKGPMYRKAKTQNPHGSTENSQKPDPATSTGKGTKKRKKATEVFGS